MLGEALVDYGHTFRNRAARRMTRALVGILDMMIVIVERLRWAFNGQ